MSGPEDPSFRSTADHFVAWEGQFGAASFEPNEDVIQALKNTEARDLAAQIGFIGVQCGRLGLLPGKSAIGVKGRFGDLRIAITSVGHTDDRRITINEFERDVVTLGQRNCTMFDSIISPRINGLEVRKACVTLPDGYCPNDLDPQSLPFVWKNVQEKYQLFPGSEYRIPPPKTKKHSRTWEEISAQRKAAEYIVAKLQQFSEEDIVPSIY